jgi:hypothetical protein
MFGILNPETGFLTQISVKMQKTVGWAIGTKPNNSQSLNPETGFLHQRTQKP